MVAVRLVALPSVTLLPAPARPLIALFCDVTTVVALTEPSEFVAVTTAV